jgi:uncharacterized metal-binding protein
LNINLFAEYQIPEIHEFARQASLQEASCYIQRDREPALHFAVKPRLQEIIEFAKRMNYQRLGLAFCGGLQQEAFLTTKVLEKHGFEVVSIVCKVGSIPKEKIGVTDSQKVAIGNYL